MVVANHKFLRIFGFLMMLLCFSSLASAVFFGVEIAPESQNVKMDETARFKLTVYHESDFTESFEIYSPDVEWDVSTDPSMDIYLKVAPKEIKSTTLLVRPIYINPGYYSLGLHIRLAGTNDVVKKNLLIGVSKTTPAEYSPAVYAKVTLPKDINPLEDIPVKIYLKNQNRKPIEKLELKLRSEFINRDYTTSLEPLEEKEIEFKLKLDPKTPPKTDALRTSIFAPGVGEKIVQFDVAAVDYNILAYGGIKTDVNISRGFLSKRKVIVLTNVGNARRQQLYEEKINIFERLFTFTEPNARTTASVDGRFLSWTVKLEAGESEEIVVKTDYKLIFYFLLLILLAGAVYFLARSPVLIKKAAMIIETVEGGISELKVIISIRNRTRYPLRELVILDKIPTIAKLKEEDELGTLKPTQLREHEHGGTLLRWNINDLDPSEERILSYKIRTKLGVLGGFKLPPALAKYKFFNYNRSRISKVENLFKSP